MSKNYLFIIILIFFSCKKEESIINTAERYSKISTGNGPEDIVLDESLSPARILVSCNARREGQAHEGEIYAINTITDKSAILPRIGEPEGLILNPHGIDIYKNGSDYFLYVISHYSLDSVDIVVKYKIENEHLLFVEYFSSPIMVSPNALTVLPDGSFYVSNDDGGGSVVFEQLFNPLGGSVVYCSTNNQWKKVAQKLQFPNGMANKNGILYLATSRDKALFTYTIEPDFTLSNKQTLSKLDSEDNLRWDGDNLLVSVHSNQIKFAINAFKENTFSPVESYRINIQTGKKQLLFQDDGHLISSASTTLIYNGNIYLAQIFNPFVLKIASK